MNALLSLAGGLTGLEAINTTFYDAVLRDPMIGYLFAKADRARLIRTETELAARLLGATEVRYSGRPLPALHAPLRLTGGHFDRRTQLLREAMQAHGLSEPVAQAWLGHIEDMRPHILAKADDCASDAGQRGSGLSIERVGAAGATVGGAASARVADGGAVT